MVIKAEEKADGKEWDRLLTGTHATVFDSIEWMEVMRRLHGVRPVFFFEEGGGARKPCCAGYATSKLGFRRLFLHNVFTENKEELFGSVRLVASENGAFMAGSAPESRWDFDPAAFGFDVAGTKTHTYIIDLVKSREQLFSGLHDTFRRYVRKAEKSGVTVENTGHEGLEDFHRLHVETYERSGERGQEIVPMSREELGSALSILGGRAEIYCAYVDGEPVNSIIMLNFNGNMFYWMGGSSLRHRNLGHGNLLFWRVAEDGRSRGMRNFDLGGIAVSPPPGSPQEGINTFKSRMGGELRTFWQNSIVYDRKKYFIFRRLRG